jgi:fibronectin type 3 domain-containing protein
MSKIVPILCILFLMKLFGQPNQPTLSFPENNSTGQSTRPTLYWNLSSGADRYQLQVSLNSNFSTTIYDDTTITTTTRQVGPLANNRTYFWRINAINNDGASPYSDTWSFTTFAAPAAQTVSIMSSFSSPGSRPHGLAWDGQSLWMIDNLENIYQLDTLGNVLKTIPFGDYFDRDLSWDGTGLWIGGGSNGPGALKINTNGVRLDSLPINYWAFSGVEWDGKYFWFGDYNFSVIHKHEKDGTEILNWEADDIFGHATGLTYDGINLWIGASGEGFTDDIFKYSITGQLVYQFNLNDIGITAEPGSFAAIAWDGKSLWYTTDEEFTIYRLSVPYYHTPPPVPTLKSPSNGSVDQLLNPVLSWNQSLDAVSYHLQVSKNSTFSTTIFDNSKITGTSIVVGPLEDNTTYYWHVSATNSGGTSNYSTNWNFTTINLPPASPQNLTATPGDRQVSLNWSANSESDFSHYTIYRNTTGDSTTVILIDSVYSPNTSYTDINLVNALTYYYWFRAVDVLGSTSELSSGVSAVPLDVTPPAQPQNLTAIAGDEQVMLSWDRNTEADFLRYRIYGSTVPNPATKIDSTTGGVTDTTKIISGLTNGSIYYFRVTAVDSAENESEFSNEDSEIPVAPSITVTSPNGGENWQVGSTHDILWMSNGTSGTVRIEYSSNNGSNWTEVIASTTDDGIHPWAVPNIPSGDFLLRVSDTDDSPSDISDGVFAVSDDPPDSPQNLSILPGNGLVYLHWNPNSESDFLRYRIYGDTLSTPIIQIDSTTSGNVNDTTAVITGLINGKRYYFRVTAVDNAGLESDFSLRVIAIPQPTLPPLAPQNLTTMPGDKQVTLRWNKNLETDFMRYRIYGGTVTNPITRIDSTTGGITDTIKIISGLTNGTIYYFRVTAVDSAGNESEFSNEVSAIPFAPYITVTSPNGGENWQVGSSHDINWNSSGSSGNVAIAYSTTGGSNWADIVTSTTDNGIYTWIIPETPSGNCLIRVRDTEGEPSDVSDSFFIISGGVPAVPQKLSSKAGYQQITLFWKANTEHDIHKYNIYRDISSPVNTLIDSVIFSSALDTFYLDSGLISGLTYFYRITAVNNDGYESDFSEEVSATPTQDIFPPTILHDPINSYPIGQNITVAASASDDISGINQFYLYYRKAGDKNSLDSTGFQNNQAQIPGNINTQQGVEYALFAKDNENNKNRMPENGFFSIQIEFDQTGVSQSTENPQHSGIKISDYRIFSIPFELDNRTPASVFESADNFGPYDPSRWRFFTINNEGMIEFNQIKNQSVINPGRGFLLITSIAGKKIRVRNGYSPNVAEFSRIPLIQGWNLVGNPFDFDIPLNNLQLSSSANLNAWELTANLWTNSPTYLNRWSGLAIHIENQADTLLIRPVSGIAKTVAFIDRFSEEYWGMRLKVDTETGKDLCNYIGITADKDGELWSEPPQIENCISLSIYPSQSSHLQTGNQRTCKQLSVSLQPAGEQGNFWDLVLNGGENGKTVVLYLEKYGEITQNYDQYLLDLEWQLAYNLSTVNEPLNIKMGSSGERNFRLLVGTKEYIKNNSQGIAIYPQAYELRQNFPNPFNSNTTIIFAIPEEAKVSLDVFNILGQKIRTLINKEQRNEGYHVIEWDSKNNRGISVASGMYIFRFLANRHVKLKKAVLIK